MFTASSSQKLSPVGARIPTQAYSQMEHVPIGILGFLGEQNSQGDIIRSGGQVLDEADLAQPGAGGPVRGEGAFVIRDKLEDRACWVVFLSDLALQQHIMRQRLAWAGDASVARLVASLGAEATYGLVHALACLRVWPGSTLRLIGRDFVCDGAGGALGGGPFFLSAGSGAPAGAGGAGTGFALHGVAVTLHGVSGDASPLNPTPNRSLHLSVRGLHTNAGAWARSLPAAGPDSGVDSGSDWCIHSGRVRLFAALRRQVGGSWLGALTIWVALSHLAKMAARDFLRQQDRLGAWPGGPLKGHQ